MVDFNRAVNLPFSFTEFGTCPAPVAGNHIPVRRDGRRAGAGPGHRDSAAHAADCQETRSRCRVKFCTFTLIDNSPDPITGERLTHRGALRGRRHGRRNGPRNSGFDGFGVGERHAQRFISSSPPVVLAYIAAVHHHGSGYSPR